MKMFVALGLVALSLWCCVHQSMSLQCVCRDPGGSSLCPTATCNVSSEGHCVYYKTYQGNVVSTLYRCSEKGQDLLGNHCSNTTRSNLIQVCCQHLDLCNNITRYLPHETPSVKMPSPSPTTSPTQSYVTAAIVVPLVAFAAVLVVITIIIIGVTRLYNKRKTSDVNSTGFNVDLNPGKVEQYLEEVTFTSGEGGGQPFLQQRTIAREIQLHDMIGCGKYGEVYHGKWRGEDYAVKVFRSFDEKSWFRETQIYNQYLLPHDNVLGYMAADITSKSDDMTQLWLITHYHKNGSLYDYLCKCEVLTKQQAARLVLSTVQGVVHLHTEIQGAHKKKPAIAHRDIKSKNILVKTSGECCIADFGMAVVQEFNEKKVNFPSNPRQGTKRYMAPEILDLTIDMNNFESFKKVDIYSLALVLWEICLKWETAGVSDPYQIPFHGMVEHDPSFDEMKEVVVIQKRRPSIPNRWNTDEALNAITQIIEECWHDSADTRLTALRVRKNLQRAIEASEKIATR